VCIFNLNYIGFAMVYLRIDNFFLLFFKQNEYATEMLNSKPLKLEYLGVCINHR